jgi:hypothetical protein
MRWAMSGADFEPATMQGWVNLGFTIGPGTNLSGTPSIQTCTGFLPLYFSGKPGVNGESHRGVDGKRLR